MFVLITETTGTCTSKYLVVRTGLVRIKSRTLNVNRSWHKSNLTLFGGGEIFGICHFRHDEAFVLSTV